LANIYGPAPHSGRLRTARIGPSVSFRSINEDNVLAALANVLYAGSATTKRRLAAKVEREKGLLVRYGGGRSISYGLP